MTTRQDTWLFYGNIMAVGFIANRADWNRFKKCFLFSFCLFCFIGLFCLFLFYLFIPKIRKSIGRRL